MCDDLSAHERPNTDPLRAFRSGLTAKEADASLRHSIDALRNAEGRSLIWFTEIARRRHFRKLGYSTIQQYALESLGLSRNLTYHFIHLATAFEQLPRLRHAVAKGEIGWTKARAVVKVASAKTERTWIEKAKRSSRRELEGEIAAAKTRAAAAKKRADVQQPDLAPTPKDEAAQTRPRENEESAPPSTGSAPHEETGTRVNPAPDALASPIPAVPTTIRFRLSPIQRALYEALLERLYKSGAIARDATREDMLLSAMDSLATVRLAADGAAASGRHGHSLPRGNASPPYTIVIYECESCQTAWVETSRGRARVSRAQQGAAHCDAIIDKEGQRRRSVVPPAVRREILRRDRRRCQAPGCGRTGFLEIHHLRPKANRGTNHPENLVTLCSSCHQLWHKNGWGPDVLDRRARSRRHPDGTS